MSMNPEQENFRQLRRLLVLKRYEQPPPGYFEHFSAEVMARIRSGEQATLFDRLGWEAPWLQRLWIALETKPILAGAFGVGVCGLLLAGMLYSESVEPASVTSFSPTVEQTLPVVATVERPVGQPLLAPSSGFDLSTTGALTASQVPASLFRPTRPVPSAWLPGIEPAGYTRPLTGAGQ